MLKISHNKFFNYYLPLFLTAALFVVAGFAYLILRPATPRAEAALTRTDVGVWVSAGDYGTAPYVTGSFTPPANALLIVTVTLMVGGGSTFVGQPTISGGSLSYTAVGNADLSESWSMRTQIFRAETGSSPSSMTITVDDDNDESMFNYNVSVVAFTGYNTSAPVAGFVTTGSTAIGNGGHTVTLSATPSVNDVTLMVLAGDPSFQDHMSPSLETGWTLVYDPNVAGGGIVFSEARRENSASTTVTVTDIFTAGPTVGKASMMAFFVQADTTTPTPPGNKLLFIKNSKVIIKNSKVNIRAR